MRVHMAFSISENRDIHSMHIRQRPKGPACPLYVGHEPAELVRRHFVEVVMMFTCCNQHPAWEPAVVVKPSITS